MPTRLRRRGPATRINPDPALPGIAPIPPIVPPGYELIADDETTPRRVWSSAKVAAEIAANAGGGSGGAGSLFIATVVAGSANAIALTVPGLILSPIPVLIQFDPAFNNSGSVQISVNGSAFITLFSRLNALLIGDELIAPVPALIRATDTTLKIVTGSI
jgi:hypothetical protein